MNTYRAYYRGNFIDVDAENEYDAQQLGSEQLKARKRHEVTLVHTHVDGVPVEEIPPE